MGILCDGFRRGIVGSYVELTGECVGGYLIPEALDAACLVGGVTEGGVCEVESHILHAHDDSLAGVCLRQLGAAMLYLGYLHDGKGGVEGKCARWLCLDARYLRVVAQCAELMEWYVGDIETAELRQRLASILRE